MKSKTESIISALRVLARDIQTDDGVVNACIEEAAGRLEELERANKNMQCSCDAWEDEVIKLRKELDETRPEPSRLEIAAMLLAAMCGSQYTWTNAEGLALRKADTLIALAKEAQS